MELVQERCCMRRKLNWTENGSWGSVHFSSPMWTGLWIKPNDIGYGTQMYGLKLACSIAVRQYSPRLGSPERVACRSIHPPTKCKRHGCQVVGRVIATTRVQSNASLLIYGRPRPKLISVSYAQPRWRNVWPISVARRRQRRLQKHKTAASYAHSDDDATKRNPSPVELPRTAAATELGS